MGAKDNLELVSKIRDAIRATGLLSDTVLRTSEMSSPETDPVAELAREIVKLPMLFEASAD